MIKVLLASPIPFDGTGYYRAGGILPQLSKIIDGGVLVNEFRGGATWYDLYKNDILFLQRPMSEQIFKMATFAQSIGVKVWTDYDDDLFHLPNESRAYDDFPDKTKRFMVSTLRLSDVVTTSTPALGNVLKQLGAKDVRVIPNALNEQFVGPAVTKANTDSFNYLWRGSDTHVADITCFSDAIIRAIEESPDVYKWHFMGYNPWAITNVVPMYAEGYASDPSAKVYYHSKNDIKVYHDNLKKIQPRVMHVPLIGNALNAAKSNIAWIEGTWAGAVTIAPKWPEWERPGVLTYETVEEYLQLLQTEHDYQKLWSESMEYIKKNLLLSHVNKQRADLVRELLGMPVYKFTVTDPQLQIE